MCTTCNHWILYMWFVLVILCNRFKLYLKKVCEYQDMSKTKTLLYVSPVCAHERHILTFTIRQTKADVSRNWGALHRGSTWRDKRCILFDVCCSPFDSSEKMKPLSISKQSVSSRKSSVYSWTAPNTPSFTEKYFIVSTNKNKLSLKIR